MSIRELTVLETGQPEQYLVFISSSCNKNLVDELVGESFVTDQSAKKEFCLLKAGEMHG